MLSLTPEYEIIIGMAAETNLPLHILQCPRCERGLLKLDACAACGLCFPVSYGKPVLIDFDDSIFCPDTYAAGRIAPARDRGSAVGRFFARLTYGRNTVAAQTIPAFLLRLHEHPRPRVLVIGGGTVGDGAEALYDDASIDLVGTDVYATDRVALICDGHRLPFRSASFDGVLIQAVLEHVLEPQRVVDEIHRVLKPQGIVLAETPFMQQVHMGAYDFTRFTFSGHRWLFRRFDQIEAGTVLGPGIALLWSIQHMARSLGAGRRGAAIFAATFFWLRILDRFTRPAQARDAASATYFLGRRAETELFAADMRAYYDAPFADTPLSATLHARGADRRACHEDPK